MSPSRAEELEELNAHHHPLRHASVVLASLGGWFKGAARAAAEPLPELTGREVSITFAGHASVLIRYPTLSIACDPMLGRRIRLIKRAVEPGLGVAELADVGLILISNSEPDHLHLPTLRKLPRSATIVVPPRCAAVVSDLGFARTVELGVGQALRHRDVDITSTPVRFESGAGRPACGYVLRGEGPSVFFCGESGYFSGFEEIGRRFRPDIALLPIGGYVPRAFRRDHMSPLDAVYAFEDLRARLLIPIRWGSFTLSYEKLDEPITWFSRLVGERDLEPYVHILQAGASAKFA